MKTTTMPPIYLLQDAEFLLRKLAQNPREIGSMMDSIERCAADLRDALTAAERPALAHTLILRTVDGDDTLSIVEHPCADARALLARLATGRVLRTVWHGSTLEADVSVA